MCCKDPFSASLSRAWSTFASLLENFSVLCLLTHSQSSLDSQLMIVGLETPMRAHCSSRVIPSQSREQTDSTNKTLSRKKSSRQRLCFIPYSVRFGIYGSLRLSPMFSNIQTVLAFPAGFLETPSKLRTDLLLENVYDLGAVVHLPPRFLLGCVFSRRHW